MIFETIKTDGLAHLSYLIGDEDAGVCAVIDPRRDVDVYLETARQAQVRITHILETHIHADFVSGSRELAARTQARIYGGQADDYGFEIQALHHGDELELGALTLRVLHTPGHAPEHLSFVVQGGGKGAEHDWAVFTGDTLFAGEVGRPDLADESPEDLARLLYASLHETLLRLDDGVEVYPAHGKGSPCGASIGARDQTTIGYERRHNPKLRPRQDRFVRDVLGDLTREPFYYRRLKQVNARGPALLEALPALTPLAPEAFQEAAEQAVVVDTREIVAFAGAHVAGSLNLALRSEFPIWAGWMLDPDRPILLVADDSDEALTARRHLLRIGCEDVRGFLQHGMRGWIEAGLPFDRLGALSVHALNTRLSEEPDDLQVLDVRGDDEWAEGHVPGARHIWLPFLKQRLDELDRTRPVAVYCGSGYRASIGASVLKQNGFEEVLNVPGGMKAWQAAGFALEKPEEEPAA